MDSVNIFWFVLSQTIYAAGTFSIMSSLFQLRFRQHISKVLLISVLESLINYLIYFGEDVGYVVPIVTVLVTFLYLAAVVKIPVLWAFVVTVTGNLIVPLIIQLALVFGSAGFFMPSELKEHIWKNYALDITSGLVYTLVALLLYSRGWGFTFDFERIRMKWERWIVIVISILATLCLPTAMILTHFNDFSLNLTFLSASLFCVFAFLLGYAVKKERDEMNFLKGGENT